MAEDKSKPKKPRKAKGSSDRASEKLADTRVLLEEQEAKSADALAFVHAVMCQIGLPRSPQKDRVWIHSNGGASLTVLAGGVTRNGKREEQPLPQGPYARLILADISTYAVRYRSRLIPMEDSVSAYMRNRLKLLVTGGAKGTYTSFKREALALATAHMELSVEYGGKFKQTKAPPVDEFEAWTVNEGDQQPLWPCELLLSERFCESLKAHAVPIDMRAYRALAPSAFAQDIYTWLAHRLPRLKAPVALPWSTLAAQFGGYASVDEFRRRFLSRLKEATAVYPDAQLEVVRGVHGKRGGSLRLKPSKAPIYPIASVVPAALGAAAQIEPVSPQWKPQDARRRVDAGGKPIRGRLPRGASPGSLCMAPASTQAEDVHEACGEQAEEAKGPLSPDELLSHERSELQERLRHLADDSPERESIFQRVRQIDRERLRLRKEPTGD